jgi:hypothetical protein
MPTPPNRQQLGSNAGQSALAEQRIPPRLPTQSAGAWQLADALNKLTQQYRPDPHAAPLRQLTLIPWQLICASMQVAIPP